MADVDRAVTYPDETTPYLTWYEGHYDVAYVALFPFCDVTGMAPAAAARLAELNWSPESDSPHDVVQALSVSSKQRPFIDALEKTYGTAVSWRAVCDQAGFASLQDLCVALRTLILALRRPYEDREGAARLVAWCEASGVFAPGEGRFPILLERSLGELFRQAGVGQLQCADEFAETILDVPPEAMPDDEPWDLPEGGWPARALVAADRSLLVVVEWDSFFAVICGRKERLERVDLSSLFEGFWCGPKTSHLWTLTEANRRTAIAEGWLDALGGDDDV